MVIVTLVAILATGLAIAGGKNGQAGKSNVAHLYLYEKNCDNWDIAEEPAWGKMKYNLSGSTFDFVFNGHDLPIGENFTLIYYPDPWPGKGLICLGSGTVNEGGNIHIKESVVDTGDLPISADDNYVYGAKIWLVLTADVSCQTQEMTGWTCDAYLFEYDLMTFKAQTD